MPMDLNALNNALGAAAQDNNLVLMEHFLKAGAHSSTVFKNNSLLDYAVEHNSAPMVQLLFKYHAKPRIGTKEVRSEIVKAAEEKKWAVVQAFIDGCRAYEKDNNFSGYQYGSALVHAAEDKQHSIVDGLIKAGASLIWEKIATKNNALHLAVKNNDAIMVSILLGAGCDPSLLNTDGKSAAGLANELKYVDCQLAFADNGAAYRLYCAVKNNNYSLVASFFLNTKHFVDWDGNTLFHIAVQYGNYQLINLLLAHQVDTQGLNKAGKTALDVAIDTNNINAVFALKKIPLSYFYDAPNLGASFLEDLRKNRDSNPSIGSIIYNELVKNEGKGQLSSEIQKLIRERHDAKEQVLAHIQTLPTEEKSKAIEMAFNETKTVVHRYVFFTGCLLYNTSTRSSQSDLNAFFAQQRGFREAALHRGSFKKLGEMRTELPESISSSKSIVSDLPPAYSTCN